MRRPRFVMCPCGNHGTMYCPSGLHMNFFDKAKAAATVTGMIANKTVDNESGDRLYAEIEATNLPQSSDVGCLWMAPCELSVEEDPIFMAMYQAFQERRNYLN